MLMKRVMPCLLLKDLSLVKTIKFKNENYIGDPINTIRIYNNLEVDELVFLDIDATNENRKPPFKLISEITNECFMPMAYGGGIRNIDDMRQIFSLGVEKIVICSYAVENPDFIRKASSLFGSQSIVVSIDVKKKLGGKYRVYTHSGTKPTKLNPIDFASQMEKIGAGEILLNSIDQDGTMEGYDLNLIKQVSSSITIPLIACGGAGKIEHLEQSTKSGASAVAAGSLFVYQGLNRAVLINFPERKELQNILNYKPQNL
ncbi:AglZ/HisF2 family acetamidino modification protein [Patescibacteria group bacterium AH-259-L05]|nr:AglZ/HisF2 family acetamidino modification protein [Patescibacteria group bacterium AH-259-L05]